MKRDTQFFLGTSGWSYDEWRGDFYPKDLPKRKWLAYYASHFKMIELNATFYRFFKPENYIKWRDSVPKNFQFIVKIPRIVTHYKLLNECDEIIQSFCELSNTLEKKLGLYLLQLSPNMPYQPERLEKTLRAFPHPKKVIVEFRHEQWLTTEVHTLLKKIGCVFCCADSPQMKLKNWLTSKTAYIRLHGRKQWYDYRYTLKELKSIAKFAKGLEQQGANKIYIAFNNDYYAYAIDNAETLKQLLMGSSRDLLTSKHILLRS